MKALVALGLVTVLLGHASGDSARAKYREVNVIGLDYTFQLPRELPAGPTIFRFENKGKVPHELNIVMLKPGVTPARFLEVMKTTDPLQPMIEGTIGVLFAGPGKRSGAGLSTELVPGRDYFVRCIFRDKGKGPQHFTMGMYSVIHVPASSVAPQPLAVRVDTVVATDYAFHYPQTLAPGHHSFAFDNQGKVRHEMAMDLLKKGVTIDSVMKVGKAGGDIDPMFEGTMGLLHTMPGKQVLGRFEVDLLPGRDYSILCMFTDSAKAPPHAALGMYGMIHVLRGPRRDQ